MTSRQLNLFKGKRQKGTLPPPPIEFKTHCALADAIKIGLNPGWLCNHFPTGELRSKATAGRLKRMGLQPGWFDFILISPLGVHHWLELKRGNAPLNPFQRAFRDDLAARGVPFAVVRSFDEAITVLRAWGVLRLEIR